MMDWVPIVFVTFKLLVLGTGMFFAIKWHYDRGNKNRAQQKSAVLRVSGTVAVVFVLLLLGLVLVTFFVGGMLGLDLTLP
mgnify:FL=1